jgi:hypothetical protein
MWNVRPSSLAGLTDEYLAYCFDQAVGEWGAFVRNELDKVKGKNADSVAGKRALVLKKLLEAKTPAARFATPTATISREEFERRG